MQETVDCSLYTTVIHTLKRNQKRNDKNLGIAKLTIKHEIAFYLMCAKHNCMRRKRSDAVHVGQHIRGSPFEESSAAANEQSVSCEKYWRIRIFFWRDRGSSTFIGLRRHIFAVYKIQYMTFGMAWCVNSLYL